MHDDIHDIDEALRLCAEQLDRLRAVQSRLIDSRKHKHHSRLVSARMKVQDARDILSELARIVEAA
jgi:hypothetical protein